jgi:hypothetical protein
MSALKVWHFQTVRLTGIFLGFASAFLNAGTERRLRDQRDRPLRRPGAGRDPPVPMGPTPVSGAGPHCSRRLFDWSIRKRQRLCGKGVEGGQERHVPKGGVRSMATGGFYAR